MLRVVWMLLIAVLLIAAGFVYFRYYRVFGEGVKSGELNYLVKKGYVFKTYEGKLIQTGIRSKAAGAIQWYEFDFSVVDEKVAQQLMVNSGKIFNLHYREYLGVVPWRGFSKYIVDSVISMSER